MATNVQQPSACEDFKRSFRLGRRQVLRAGGLGLLGGYSGMSRLLSAQQRPGVKQGSGKAKSCIFLFMWGGPSQLDTFDLKPQAPAEVRGDFKAVSTAVPGVQICEHFQRLPKFMDRVALIRSLSHDDPAHLSSGHTTLTGHLAPVVKSDAEPPSGRDSPHLGSVIARRTQGSKSLPAFVTMPWKAYHPAAPGGQAPGQNAGWLGRAYDPMLITGDPSEKNWRVDELSLPADITLQRLQSRQELSRVIDQQRFASQNLPNLKAMSSYQAQVMELLSSPQASKAFDLTAEPDKVRERYGNNIHGQCVLLARRLVEHGVPFVSVNWHNDGRNFWDTHGNNFNRLKNDLIPPADRALSALLEDLEQRGLLDETLVCWVGEFGRRPQITANNAGREHWPFCYSGLLAGGGIRGGAVYGASDKQAQYPLDNPVSPQDYAATVYHGLGVNVQDTFPDYLGRPLHFCDGNPITELFA